MGKILITGGTGFIGSHIVEYFKNMGEDMQCITRQQADVRDLDSLTSAFDEADCVIHNAAMANDWGKFENFFENNVKGTLNVLKACKQNGIRQVILTSSCSVYGEENNDIVKDENSPLNSHYPYFLDTIFPCAMNYYRDTKKAAKTSAIDFSKANNINLTIIEPVWVYGEREFNTGFYEYLKTAKDKIPFIMGSKKNKFHVIYAKDLAKVYYLAYKANLRGVNDFIAGNDKAEYMDRIYQLFCEYAELLKPKNAPKWLMYPIGFIMELFYTIFKVKTPPMLTRGRINMFYDNIEYNAQKAKDMLGFECDYTLEQGIKNTVNWYKENGYI